MCQIYKNIFDNYIWNLKHNSHKEKKLPSALLQTHWKVDVVQGIKKTTIQS